MAKVNGIEVTPKIIQQIYDLFWRHSDWDLRNIHEAINPRTISEWSTSAHLDNARKVIYALRAYASIPYYVTQMYKFALKENNLSKINGMDRLSRQYNEKITWIDVDNLINMYNKYKCE